MTSGDFKSLGPADWADLETSYRRTRPLLLKLAKRFLGRFHRDDNHEDVTQVAVIKLWLAAPRYSPQKDPRGLPLNRYFESAFARTALYREAITEIRAARRRLKHVVQASQDFDALPATHEPDRIDERIDEKEQQQRLNAAIRQALAELEARDAAIVRAVRHDTLASLEQQRVRAELLLGQPIPRSVFSTAKSRAIARFDLTVKRILSRKESDPNLPARP